MATTEPRPEPEPESPDDQDAPKGRSRAKTGPTGVVTDGRHARSERSRQAMVEALLELLQEGNLRPSSLQIAERAGVTQRTLFNQFGDMESLVQAVAVRQARRVLSLLPEAGDGSLDERVTNYCRGLEVLLEETMQVRWAVVSNPHADWSGAHAVTTAREFMRAHLAEAFAPELDRLDDADHSTLLDALEHETDPAAWRLRRVQQGLTVDEARRAVERTVGALLRDAVA
jgi:AcrR family transcriptional regulator